AGSRRRWTDAAGVLRLRSRRPPFDALRPRLDLARRVAALVEFPRAVEANVDPVRRDVFAGRELPGDVGDDEGDVVLTEQIDELRGHEALVPELDRVADRMCRIRLRVHAALHPRAVPACEH